ncbi:MAG TPA: hypothetical protein VF808_20065 [Ktedonobacterales bacterium]
MQQPWSTPNVSADQQQTGPAQPLVLELGGRAETLLRRLHDVEEALTDQEWWLMGNVFPEARRLAEVTSLLSVARGELEGFLVDVCGMTVPETQEPQGAGNEVFALMGDPMWMSGSREKAVALLRMLAAQVPPMRQYAIALQSNAERLRVPSNALDPLGITAERLTEIEDILGQPLT